MCSRTPTNYRRDDSQCSTVPPAGNCNPNAAGPNSCTSDADCTAGLNGRCINAEPYGIGNLPRPCACTYDTCVHDTDCGTGNVCACHGSTYMAAFGNKCVPGNCRVDADCGPGCGCSPSLDVMVQYDCSVGGYYCHTPTDLCSNDLDCTGLAGENLCQYVGFQVPAWACGDTRRCAGGF
jgi:hypothetical protein